MERTCVGCRQLAERADLLRVVERSNVLTFDERKSLSGRGAWVHPKQECLELAITRRAFIRALKLSGQPDSSGLIITKEQAETMLATK
ncbi:MAG: YlxR family protein [Rhodoluna sp.]